MVHTVIPVTKELCNHDLERIPRSHIGAHEIVVDKQECKTVSVAFCGLMSNNFTALNYIITCAIHFI